MATMKWVKTDGGSYESGEYRIAPEYSEEGHNVRAWTWFYRECEQSTEWRLRDAKKHAESHAKG